MLGNNFRYEKENVFKNIKHIRDNFEEKLLEFLEKKKCGR